MTIVLLAICIFGIGVGYIQGKLDPENHISSFTMFQNLAKEVQFSTFLGMMVGLYGSWSIWLLRSFEIVNIKIETPE